MKNKLAEHYGRRFTPGSKIVLFVVIILFGIFIAFSGDNVNSNVNNADEKNILDDTLGG